MINGTESAPKLDPKVARLLARLEAVGHPDVADTRPEAEVLEERDAIAAELERLVGSHRAEDRAEDLASEVERLTALVLDPARGDEALPALRAAIAKRRRALGLEDAKRVASLAERLLARLNRPPLVHVPTSLPTLDAATRGGLLLRRVHVIGGEPDAGKTALLVQMLLQAAREGYAVAIYAVDEPGEGIEDRIGQSLGLALDDLEANVQRAILWLADAVRNLPNVLLIEQGEEGFETIEDAADALLAHARRHGCKGAILGLDSLQTSACRAFFGPTAPRMDRERIEAMTTALKSLAKRGLGVICTSELGRAAYASKPGSKPTSPMAAFKGSGSIEYAMTVGIVLTRIPKGEHAGDVMAVVPKNKRGDPAFRNVRFRLSRDPDRCTYTDCGRLDDEQAPDEAPKKTAGGEPKASEKMLERVRAELRKHPRGVAGGIEGLAELVGGKRPAARSAVRVLDTAGEIARRGGRLFHVEQLAAEGDPDVTAEQLRARVLAFLATERDAGRVVPSATAVHEGLRETGCGARKSAVLDAIEVLVHAGQVERMGKRLALPEPWTG